MKEVDICLVQSEHRQIPKASQCSQPYFLGDYKNRSRLEIYEGSIIRMFHSHGWEGIMIVL